MDSKTLINKLLYSILVEIRTEAYEAKNAKIFHLADISHNIPLQLNNVDKADNYDDIMEWLTNRAKEKNCEEWFGR